MPTPNKYHKPKTSLVWGIPCDEVMYSRFFVMFMKHSGFMPNDIFAFSEGTYLPKARNMIHNAFLESGRSHLMMLDSDILFPPNIAETLMKHNLPIVGGWYLDKKGKHPTVYDFGHEDEKGVSLFKHRDAAGTGLEKVDATGAGCWLMRRDVAEALGKDPYNMESGGEDMVLCRKLMKLEIPLHVDWSINCAHLGVFHV